MNTFVIMKKLYLIKDIGTDSYYWSYRIDRGFGDLEGALRFASEAEAISRIEQEIAIESEIKRELQIIGIYVVGK